MSKTREYKRIHGSKLEATLKSVIAQHEKFKSSFFWTPPCNANGRRSMEKANTREPLSFRFDGRTYHVEQSVDCSCANVYYIFSVTVDGTKKDIRAIKKLVKAA